MIKITRTHKPAELTDELQKSLTQKFAETKEPVWNLPFLKQALLAMTNNKCAYSEAPLNTKKDYMEVEHFRCKNIYPKLVMEWDNLLPSHKSCNGKKNDLDVEEIPFVDPVNDNPQDHIYVDKTMLLKWLDEKGENSIKILGLNVSFSNDRIDLAHNTISKTLQDRLENWFNADTKQKKAICRSKLYNLMECCDSQKPYSGFLACYLLNIDDNYKTLKKQMLSEGFWNDKLQEKENELRAIALPWYLDI